MNKVELGNFVKEERLRQLLSQKELASKAGLARRQQIIEIENSQYAYSIDVLIKVINALGYDIEPKSFRQLTKLTPVFDFRLVKSAKPEDEFNQ